MDEKRYREVEQRLWRTTVGREPSERRIRLASTDTEVRVQEVGSGEPVVFIHGGQNAGATWAPLVEHLPGIRCLIVDRPGTGLSQDYVITAEALPRIGARFVADVLDGLGLDRAGVVASSFGGHLALRSAAAHPERIDRMVQMGSPAAVPGETYPLFMRLMRHGLVRRVLRALPPNDRANRSIFRQIGHGASLDSGRIPDIVFEWYLALGRYTHTLANDGRMMGAEILSRLPQVTLSADLLAGVTTPTLFLWGSDDGFGGEDQARRFTTLIPGAELSIIDAAGHLPWLDEPVSAAGAIAGSLSSTRTPVGADRLTAMASAA
jgi:pimeloyl-ACP methyl ester carboxylesterase